MVALRNSVAKAPRILPLVWLILTYLFSSSGITIIFLLSQNAYLPLLSPLCLAVLSSLTKLHHRWQT